MPSVFAAMALRLGAAVNRTFGEPFEYRPMVATDPNARAVPDVSRAVKTITATYSAVFARSASGPARRQGVQVERAPHASGRPTIEFDLAQLPYEVRHGDRMLRMDTGELFHISEPRPNGNGRILADVNFV